jgi:hypothetical protein
MKLTIIAHIQANLHALLSVTDRLEKWKTI